MQNCLGKMLVAYVNVASKSPLLLCIKEGAKFCALICALFCKRYCILGLVELHLTTNNQHLQRNMQTFAKITKLVSSKYVHLKLCMGHIFYSLITNNILNNFILEP